MGIREKSEAIQDLKANLILTEYAMGGQSVGTEPKMRPS